jgi:flagellar M-ring protein FliF
VEVSVDTNNQTEQITERRFDPEGRVAVSTDTEERTSRSEGAEAGLTVASNLPDGEADTTKGSTSADNETRERINYEVSETTREISRQSGDIQRLTVAALINGIVEISPNGTEIFTPLDTQDLTALEELIASAVGFDENRGDLITIHSMQFNNIDFEGTAANDLVWYNNIVDLSSILKIALSGLVSLIIGLTVIRPIFRKNSSVEQENSISLNTLDESLPVLNSDPINFSENTNDLPMLVSEDSVFDQPPPLGTSNENEPALRLKALIDNHKDETIEILESWITENDVKI